MEIDDLCVQFPDLTEIYYMEQSYNPSTIYLEDIKKIKTEFIFHVAATAFSENAEELGFKCVASMNNWYDVHRTQKRRMNLYWLRNPYWKGEPQKPFRMSWAFNRGSTEHPYGIDRTKELDQDTFLAGSGCGFNIGEPPFVKTLMYRFFTLMRMPLTVMPVQKRWLTKHNYRPLETGALASYWINGWDPDTYDYKNECEYFEIDGNWNVKPKVKEVKV